MDLISNPQVKQFLQVREAIVNGLKIDQGVFAVFIFGSNILNVDYMANKNLLLATTLDPHYKFSFFDSAYHAKCKDELFCVMQGCKKNIQNTYKKSEYNTYIHINSSNFSWS